MFLIGDKKACDDLIQDIMRRKASDYDLDNPYQNDLAFYNKMIKDLSKKIIMKKKENPALSNEGAFREVINEWIEKTTKKCKLYKDLAFWDKNKKLNVPRTEHKLPMLLDIKSKSFGSIQHTPTLFFGSKEAKDTQKGGKKCRSIVKQKISRSKKI